MKRRARILCLLVSALVVFAMFPIHAATATDYGKVFNDLKVDDAKKYNDPLPTGGGKKTAAQINKSLAKIGKSIPGKGNAYAESYLAFSAYKTDIYSIKKFTSWTLVSGTTTHIYSEYNMLKPVYKNTYCEYTKLTAKNSRLYKWDKGWNTGKLVKAKVTKPKKTDYMKYPDATVLEQKCFVYSYKYKDKASGETYTVYNWVSKKTGLTLKTVEAESSRPVAYTTVYFVQKIEKKEAKFFDIPTGVTFK